MLVIFLSIVLVMSGILPVIADAIELKDIIGNPYANTINKWVNNGFINGFPDGTFKPGNQITRAEIMAMVNRSFRFTEMGELQFTDVKTTDWYYKEIAKAVKAGYIQGYNGMVNPKGNISRQEMAVILSKLGKLDTSGNLEATANLDDAKAIPEWSIGAINVCMSKKLFEGFVTAKFNPAQNITRIEALVTLDRLLTYMGFPGGIPSKPAIGKFEFEGLSPKVIGNINEAEHLIVLQVPYGTNIRAMVPNIIHNGVSIMPESGAVQDFSAPVTYTVTAANGIKQAYTVKVTVASNPAASTSSSNSSGGSGGGGGGSHGGGNIPIPPPVVDNTTYTRGQWIQLLAEKLNFDFSSVDIDEYDYKYADTEASEYGLAIEMAEAYGILPTPDSEGYEDPDQDIPLFRPDELATREFGAYTAVKAMGFMGEYSISCADESSLKYPNEVAVAIQQGFLSLSNNKFNPNAALSGTDKNSIFNAIDIINNSTQVDVSNPRENVTFADGVIRESLSNITDYSLIFNDDDTISVTLPKSSATSEISIGKVFILPPNEEYISGVALKAISITDIGNDKLTIICSEPDITEVLTNLEFVGIGTVDTSNIVAAEDVICEYDPHGSIEDEDGELHPLNIEAGVSVPVPGKLTFKVINKKIAEDVKASGTISIEIPNITCKVNASIGLLSGVNLKELVISITEKAKLTGKIEFTALESGYQLTDTHWLPANIEIGRLPIKLGATGLSIDIVFFYNVNAKGSASITYTVVTTQGIQVRNGSMRLIRDFSHSLDFLAVKGSFKAGAGAALRLNAFKLMDLIGIAWSRGLGLSASFTPHITEVGTIYCADGTAYQYQTLELDTETAFGMFIKAVYGTTWSWDIWDENNSPYKGKFHFENGTRVDNCTFGVGSIEGYVLDASNDRAIHNARVNLYSGVSLVKTLYSNNSGKFSLSSLDAGVYTLKVSATGYQTFTSSVTIAKNQTTYVEALLMIDRSSIGLSGNVGGTVTDALTGGSVSDVTYNVRYNWNNLIGDVIKTGTAQNGSYLIELAAGNYTIEFIKSGYVTTSINVAIRANANTLKHVAMSPETSGSIGGDVRIVLTWGETPSDLDSHLYGPTVDGSSTFHTWYAAKDYYADGRTIANLDLDDTTSFGPETTTVYELNHSGVYSFYVHDFTNRESNNSTELASSHAQVRVYSGNQLVATYIVPLDREGTLWHVFDYDAETDTLRAVNTFSYSGTPGEARPDTLTLMSQRFMMQMEPVDKSELVNLLETVKNFDTEQLSTEVLKIIVAAEAIVNDASATQKRIDAIFKLLDEKIENINVLSGKADETVADAVYGSSVPDAIFIEEIENINVLLGNVSGTITDALTGESVSDVTYNVRYNWDNLIGDVIKTGTVQNESYSIELTAGNYTIDFKKSGYVTTSINVAIQANENILKHVAMSPETSGSIDENVNIDLMLREAQGL